MDTIANRLRMALDMRSMKQSELSELTGIGNRPSALICEDHIFLSRRIFTRWQKC